MNYYQNSSSSHKTVYFRVNVNERMSLVQMQITPEGLLRYPGKFVGDFFEDVDSEAAIQE